VFIGNSFGGVFDALYERIAPSSYFALQAVIAAAATLAFFWVTKPKAKGEVTRPAVASPAEASPLGGPVP
jgi:hypothetical protein